MAYTILPCLRSEAFKRYHQQSIAFYSFRRGYSPSRKSFCQQSRHYAGAIGGPSTPGQIDLQGEDAEGQARTGPKNTQSSWRPTLFKMFESAATTFASILVLGLAGYGYHRVRSFLAQNNSTTNSYSTCKPSSKSESLSMLCSSCGITQVFTLGRDTNSEIVLVL